MTWLLWARLPFLAALVALVGAYAWAHLRSRA
jgi:hypothetical protein